MQWPGTAQREALPTRCVTARNEGMYVCRTAYSRVPPLCREHTAHGTQNKNKGGTTEGRGGARYFTNHGARECSVESFAWIPEAMTSLCVCVYFSFGILPTEAGERNGREALSPFVCRCCCILGGLFWLHTMTLAQNASLATCRSYHSLPSRGHNVVMTFRTIGGVFRQIIIHRRCAYYHLPSILSIPLQGFFPRGMLSPTPYSLYGQIPRWKKAHRTRTNCLFLYVRKKKRSVDDVHILRFPVFFNILDEWCVPKQHFDVQVKVCNQDVSAK